MKLELAGYAGQPRFSDSVDAPLELNVIALRSSQDTRPIILLSGDLLYWTGELRDGIAQRLSGDRSFNRESLLLFASHTHTAPSTDRTKPLLGRVHSSFLELLEETAATLVHRALRETPIEIRMRHKRIALDHALCRRRIGFRFDPKRLRVHREVYMGPNRKATDRDEADIIDFVDQEGLTRALLWLYACHPTGYPLKSRIHPDYPGVVRNQIRSVTNAPLPVVFMQGAAGDRRPNTIGSAVTFRQRLLGLFGRQVFPRFDKDGWRNWSGTMADRVARTCVHHNGWKQINGVPALYQSEIPLTQLIQGNPPVIWPSVELRLLRLGKDFVILVISAEVVSCYRRLTSALSPRTQILLAGYQGQTFGYLPTDNMVRQGGYEASGFFKYFGLDGQFRPGLQTRVLGDVARLLNHSEISQ